MVDLSRIPTDRIGLGSTVTLLDIDKDERITFKLVTSDESDVAKGHISTSSPIGKGLLGRQVGEEVRIRIPGGFRTLEVLELSTIHQAGS
jgi:transcription elongation factor GreA